MDPFATRRLGKTELQLPLFGYGGAPLGDLFTSITDADAEIMLNTAWDAGVRYYDTAPLYGWGQSEHRTGRCLYTKPREEVIISTKVGRLLKAPINRAACGGGMWSGGLRFDEVYDYSYDGIMRSYEDSLQRLGMNKVDLLIVHDLDWRNHKTTASVDAYLAQLKTSGWRALEELKQSGEIAGIGAGVNDMGTMPRFLDLVDLDFFLVAGRYTLLDQRVLDEEFPQLEANDVGVILGAPFASGILATGAVPGAKCNYENADEPTMERVRNIQAVCERHNTPLIAAALQFVFGHHLVANVIPGAYNAEQVTSNLAHMRREIPADLWAELKHEKLLREDAPTPA
jgi:D-threo-aldose 1-dehydrogenase